MSNAMATDDPAFKLRAERLEYVTVDGEVVVLDNEGSQYYFVNETGGELWTALGAGTTAAALTQLLVAHHGVDEARAHADVTAFLAQLTEAGLLDQIS